MTELWLNIARRELELQRMHTKWGVDSTSLRIPCIRIMLILCLYNWQRRETDMNGKKYYYNNTNVHNHQTASEKDSKDGNEEINCTKILHINVCICNIPWNDIQIILFCTSLNSLLQPQILPQWILFSTCLFFTKIMTKYL